MLKPTPEETEALAQSEALIRFAAEHNGSLDESLTRAIAQARMTMADDQWTPEASENFWTAFNKLCTVVRPTTLDGLKTLTKDYQHFSIRRWRKENVSLAELTSSRFQAWLLVAILLALPLQLYVWGGKIESNNISDSLERLQKATASLSPDYAKVSKVAPVEGSTDKWPPGMNDQVDKLVQDEAALNAEVDRLINQVQILHHISLRGDAVVVGPLELTGDWYKDYWAVMNRYDKARVVTLRLQEEANLTIGVFLSFILPLLFGVIGAIAYVVRSISNEISTTTFSRTSPIRHLMRVTLGALAGVVVGLFTNVSNQLSLPPLALAFLAGYGVEPLFSMFDSLVARFKNTDTPPAGAKAQ